MKIKGKSVKKDILDCFNENPDLTAVEISRKVQCSAQFARDVLNCVPLYVKKKEERQQSVPAGESVYEKAIQRIVDYNTTLPPEYQSTREEVVSLVDQFDKKACLNSFCAFRDKVICKFVLDHYTLDDGQVAKILNVTQDVVMRARHKEGIPSIKERFEYFDSDIQEEESFHERSTFCPERYQDYVAELRKDGYEPPCIPPDCWDRFFELSRRKRAWKHFSEDSFAETIDDDEWFEG